MTEKMNKIQIRAEVFSSLNNILSSDEGEKNLIPQTIERLNNIEDKDFLAKLLIKEFIDSKDSERSAVINLILTNCVPLKDLENHLWSNLALKTVSDEKKYQLIDILKSMGKFIEYDKYLDYFDEPQKVIEMDTQRLLSCALLNPEAQIDFLDFMETLSVEDKKLLIQSMTEDYSSDDLANIISPIIMCEKDETLVEIVIKEIITAKSPLSYYPLKRYGELSKNEILKKLANRGLKELQIAGINEEKAKSYYLRRFKNSILYNCYVSMPDGKGNIGMIFSRIRSDNSLQMFCVVINDIKGITDCFGLSDISTLEYSLIIKKFFNEEMPLSITFEAGLSWLNEAEKLTFEKDMRLPYEYFCWKEILFDVPDTLINKTDFVEKAVKILPKKDCNLEEIFKSDVLSKLFFTKNDNINFDAFIDETDKMLAHDGGDLQKVEQIIKTSLPKIFDDNTKKIFVSRMHKISFILMSNSENNMASQVYDLTQNEELLKEFFIEVLKKSIFVFYRQEFQNKVNAPENNIFMRKVQKTGSALDLSKIKELLEIILKEWAKDE